MTSRHESLYLDPLCGWAVLDQGWACAVVDTVGTGYGGVAKMFRCPTERNCTITARVYRNLGLLEAEGVLEAIKYLAMQHATEIDSSRIGLHGWSFGGFLTLATMTSQMVGGRRI